MEIFFIFVSKVSFDSIYSTAKSIHFWICYPIDNTIIMIKQIFRALAMLLIECNIKSLLTIIRIAFVGNIRYRIEPDQVQKILTSDVK